MRFTVITPAHNEEKVIGEFARRAAAALRSFAASDSELLIIDDASVDGTWAALEAAAGELGPMVRIDRLPVRSGQVGAQRRGIELARGENLIFMDGDLQIPPEQLPAVGLLMTLNYDVVATFHSHLRSRRRLLDLRVLAYAPANRFGNWLLRVLCGTHVRSASSDFLGIKARWLKGAPLGGNDQRYLIPIALRRGASRLTEIRVDKQKRVHGRSKYSVVWKMATGLVDIIALWRRIRSGYYDPVPAPDRAARAAGGPAGGVAAPICGGVQAEEP